ncbi:MFS transporter [Streptomyces sp. I05A-00742]|uniref:MFS transporter n=1 Tax=Streptomyces sp. I05A-00742 TaxID=2732853 RepID=UPI001488B62C|nr:MFS transporter [Streptomyces sp. I05A-00742]
MSEARAGDDRPRRGLWQDADFLKFWSAESLSMFGAQISLLAIPLLAATTLDATPFEMGVVNAAQFAPYMLFTLLAGVWIDRSRRRPIMIGANFGRAVILGLVPVLTALDVMGIGLLSAIVFLAATLTVLFDLAYQAYIPSLVGRDQLIEGNGKLEGSRSLAQASGPGLGGVLVGLVTAPVAVLVNAGTYLVSAISLLFIRRAEAPPPPSAAEGSVLSRIGTGLRLVGGNPYLRAIAGEAATYNLFNQGLWAVLVLYLTRDLHFSPVTLGVVMAMTGIGAFLGSLVAGRLGRRFGIGRTVMVTMVIACAAPLLIPAAGGGKVLTATVVALALMTNGMTVVISNIQVMSLRQTVAPPEILGRANAGYRFLVTGTAALGALLGGWLGGFIGLRATLVVTGLGTFLAPVFLTRSPLPRLRDLSEVVPDGGEGRAEARAVGPAAAAEAGTAA